MAGALLKNSILMRSQLCSKPTACTLWLMIIGTFLSNPTHSHAWRAAQANRKTFCRILVLKRTNSGFGDSDTGANAPRQEIIPSQQLSDWSDAITYAQSRSEVDPKKIGIWVNSDLGGGVLTSYISGLKKSLFSILCTKGVFVLWRTRPPTRSYRQESQSSQLPGPVCVRQREFSSSCTSRFHRWTISCLRRRCVISPRRCTQEQSR